MGTSLIAFVIIMQQPYPNQPPQQQQPYPNQPPAQQQQAYVQQQPQTVVVGGGAPIVGTSEPYCGIISIIVAIVFFPCGLLVALCPLDKRPIVISTGFTTTTVVS